MVLDLRENVAAGLSCGGLAPNEELRGESLIDVREEVNKVNLLMSKF